MGDSEGRRCCQDKQNIYDPVKAGTEGESTVCSHSKKEWMFALAGKRWTNIHQNVPMTKPLIGLNILSTGLMLPSTLLDVKATDVQMITSSVPFGAMRLRTCQERGGVHC